MNAMQLNCPICAGTFQIDASMAGQQVGCPHCSQLVSIPAAEPGFPANGAGVPSQFGTGLPTPTAQSPIVPSTTAQLGCPLCNGVFQITPEMAGQQVGCPLCQGLVTIPGGPEPVQPQFATPQPIVAPAQQSLPQTPLQQPQPVAPISPVVSQSTPNPTVPNNPIPVPQQPAVPATTPLTEQTIPSPAMTSNYPPGMGPTESKQEPIPNVTSAPSVGSPEQKLPSPPSNVLDQLAPKSDDAPVGSQNRPEPKKRPIPAPSRQPTPRVDGILPPGAAPANPQIDSLLPPGATASTPILVSDAAGSILPTSAENPTTTIKMAYAKSAVPKGPVTIPTEDGDYVTLQEVKKTVGHGDEERELIRLTPEEKDKRRFKRNIIVWSFCAVVLALTCLILFRIGGG